MIKLYDEDMPTCFDSESRVAAVWGKITAMRNRMKYREAIDCLKKELCKQNNSNEEAYFCFLLGDAYARIGEKKEAIAVLNDFQAYPDLDSRFLILTTIAHCMEEESASLRILRALSDSIDYEVEPPPLRWDDVLTVVIDEDWLEGNLGESDVRIRRVIGSPYAKPRNVIAALRRLICCILDSLRDPQNDDWLQELAPNDIEKILSVYSESLSIQKVNEFRSHILLDRGNFHLGAAFYQEAISDFTEVINLSDFYIEMWWQYDALLAEALMQRAAAYSYIGETKRSKDDDLWAAKLMAGVAECVAVLEKGAGNLYAVQDSSAKRCGGVFGFLRGFVE